MEHKIKNLMLQPSGSVKRIERNNLEARIANAIYVQVENATKSFKQNLMQDICKILKSEI